VGAIGTDEHDEANSHFSQFWKHAKKKCTVYSIKKAPLHFQNQPSVTATQKT